MYLPLNCWFDVFWDCHETVVFTVMFSDFIFFYFLQRFVERMGHILLLVVRLQAFQFQFGNFSDCHPSLKKDNRS